MRAWSGFAAVGILLVLRRIRPTGQMSELVELERGEQMKLYAEPLSQYPMPTPIDASLCPTGLNRGYIGTWKLNHDSLYLKSVDGKLQGGGGDPMETWFSDAAREESGLVLATWFSGRLRISRGKVIAFHDYVGHPDSGPVHEEEILVTVEKGRVTARTEISSTGEELKRAREEHWRVADILEHTSLHGNCVSDAKEL